MPVALRNFLPASVNDTEVEGFYGDITLIKEYPFGDVVREGATRAYEQTVFPLWSAALGLSFVCLIAACFQVSSLPSVLPRGSSLTAPFHAVQLLPW